jgi:hypothetical protein
MTDQGRYRCAFDFIGCSLGLQVTTFLGCPLLASICDIAPQGVMLLARIMQAMLADVV